MPELASILDAVDPSLVLFRLRLDRINNRPGFPLEPLWRAYLASFVLNLPHTNALIRRLEDDANLRAICGFGDRLPHRTTFNRFIRRLSHHPILVEYALSGLTDELKALLPKLGNVVAVDSTTVRTHGNPNRAVLSDPEASWTAKNSPRARRTKKGKSSAGNGKGTGNRKKKDDLEEGKEWSYGYKLHAVADATYGIPLSGIVTTAKRNDSPFLPKVIDHTQAVHPWLKPKAVIADRGYDSQTNHHYLYRKTIASIIHIRRNAKALNDETHSLDGRPFCFGKQPMAHITTNPRLGHLYRCPPEGCTLKGSMKTGIRHCNHQHWEHPGKDIRFFSWIPRHSRTWKDLYTKRQAIERFFKSAKESRRLEKHCVRGLRGITLHALMSVIGFQATALVKARAGQMDDMRWMVRKVA